MVIWAVRVKDRSKGSPPRWKRTTLRETEADAQAWAKGLETSWREVQIQRLETVLDRADLQEGHVYRSRKVREVRIFTRATDDREILYLGASTVTYDSATVRLGRRYPSVGILEFLLWAVEDVTHLYPEGSSLEIGPVDPEEAQALITTGEQALADLDEAAKE